MSGWWHDAWRIASHPLMAPIVVTGVAGLVAYVSYRRAPLIPRVLSIVASAAALVLTVRLFLAAPVTFDAPFMDAHGLRVAVVMTNRALGAMIAMGCAFFGVLISVYALSSEHGEASEGRFHTFLCWTLTGAIGAALADDLIWLLICWELLSLCLYLLLSAGRAEGAPGSAKTFAMIGLGDAAVLLAIALVVATQGTTRLSALSMAVDSPLTTLCYLLFAVAALAKMGAAPMHTWVPAAATHASASAFALLPASIDKLIGAYLLVRVSFGVFALDPAMKVVLLVVGAVTVLVAAAAALMQTQFKRLVAYQAVSSAGYIVLGIATGSPIGLAGAVFHAVNAAVYQASLFFAGGIMERRAGSDALDRIGGLARGLPATMASCVIAALAISGVPPLNGFASKWLVYQGCLGVASPLAMLCLVVAVFGSALTLAASIKLLSSVLWGSGMADTADDARPTARNLALAAPTVLLAVVCVGFGIAAQWPLQYLVAPAVADVSAGASSLVTEPNVIEAADLGLWGPAPATVLILLGVLGGLLLYVVGRVGHARVANAFIGGETAPSRRTRQSPASGFYRTLEDLPVVGAALRDEGSGALDVYRLGGQYGGSLVSVLKAQHTGVLSLYVSWCLLGAVAIVAYLMIVL